MQLDLASAARSFRLDLSAHLVSSALAALALAVGLDSTSVAQQCTATTDHYATFGPLNQTLPDYLQPTLKKDTYGPFTLAVARHDPSLGALLAASIDVALECGAKYDANLIAPSPFAGVNANLRTTAKLAPTGGAAVTSQVFFNQTVNMGASGGPAVHIAYPTQSAGSSTVSIAAASLGSYVGSGTIAIPLTLEHIQDVFSSQAPPIGHFSALGIKVTAHVRYLYASPFVDLGGASAGVSGEPKLCGFGNLHPNGGGNLELANAAPAALAVLAIADQASVPLSLFGGVVHANPASAVVVLTTSASGTLQIPFQWPGASPGAALTAQFGIVDAAAQQGIALSNAVRGITL